MQVFFEKKFFILILQFSLNKCILLTIWRYCQISGEYMDRSNTNKSVQDRIDNLTKENARLQLMLEKQSYKKRGQKRDIHILE